MSTIRIDVDAAGPTIDRNIYGHFAEHLGRCIYDGFVPGEGSEAPQTRGIRNDIVAALRNLNIPVLRWPGGCFADDYHWMDGIGPKESRPTIVNVHWGGVTETNAFGTHEFMDLCDQLGCAPYISGNVGSGAVREMKQWVEYLTFPGQSPMADLRRRNGRDEPWKVPYWGVGNENWGCGGNMRPEYYADLYRHFATYCRSFGDNRLHRIACGANSDDYHWTDVVMRQVPRNQMWGLSLHYYTVPGRSWVDKWSATQFDEPEWFQTLRVALRMDEIITKHREIMDRHDPDNRVALVVDEWGTWWKVEPGTNPGFLYQQNTLRDAMVASLTLDIFHRHCERVRMANIAQTVNVLQAMILTAPGGGRMLLTPTYHVFEMYKVHQGGTRLPLELQTDDYRHGDAAIPRISATASRDEQGHVHVCLTNVHPSEPVTIACSLSGRSLGSVAGRILTASEINAHNTFDAPEKVRPEPFDGATLRNGQLQVAMPAKSIVALRLTP